MRIAVVGVGGTGGYFGGLLARAGEHVTFIARGATLAALRANGLTVESQVEGTFTVPGAGGGDRCEEPRAVLYLGTRGDVVHTAGGAGRGAGRPARLRRGERTLCLARPAGGGGDGDRGRGGRRARPEQLGHPDGDPSAVTALESVRRPLIGDNAKRLLARRP
jgi:Ketopantoate reductase PanE/ApbA